MHSSFIFQQFIWIYFQSDKGIMFSIIYDNIRGNENFIIIS